MNIKRNNNSIINRVWIGLVTVVPLPGNNDLSGYVGAVVNVMYYTNSQRSYKKEVALKLLEYGFKVENIEDIEEFDFNAEYQDNLKIKAMSLSNDNRLDWGTFYTFETFDDV